MTIDEIKTISLIDYLSHHSYTCKKSYRNRYWYLSPLHNENEASFKVDTDCNLWYDFGLGKGGNIINLAQQLNPQMTAHEVLAMLENEARDNNYSYVKYLSAIPESEHKGCMPNKLSVHNKCETVITSVTALVHPNLIRYIESRNVLVDVAKHYCRQVNYSVGEKNYYAIAFYNNENGMEARNKYSKRCIGVKTYSVVLIDPPHHASRCCVFEGFFDFLSYMTLWQSGNQSICIQEKCDFVILNSVSNLHKAIPYLNYYKYIHCYLDNDAAGKKATNNILKNYLDKATDESFRYRQYSDLNDVMTGKHMTNDNV